MPKRLDDIAAMMSTMNRDIDSLKSLTGAPIAVKVIELPEKRKDTDTSPHLPKLTAHKMKSQ